MLHNDILVYFMLQIIRLLCWKNEPGTIDAVVNQSTHQIVFHTLARGTQKRCKAFNPVTNTKCGKKTHYYCPKLGCQQIALCQGLCSLRFHNKHHSIVC